MTNETEEQKHLRIRDMILYGISWFNHKYNEDTGKVEVTHIPHGEVYKSSE